MRIGIVTGEYAPKRGGVGDFCRELGHALIELGHEVHIVASEDRDGSSATSEAAGLPVDRQVMGWGWGCWGQVLEQAARLRVDVLNVQFQTAAYGMHPAIHFIPRSRRVVPVVVTFHDLKVPYLFPKAGATRWWLVKLLARRADGAIATNAEDFARLQQALPTQRLRSVPIGSNIPNRPPDGYDRAIERARWAVGKADVLIGFFGFLNRSKGAEELVQALSTVTRGGVPAHLLLIGGQVGSSDPENRLCANEIGRWIRDLGLLDRVKETGFIGPEQVSAALLATDFCVLPYRDGVSFRRGSLQACLTHGRAIISTAPAIPVPEVRDSVNMVLAQPRDPHSLAEAMIRLATEPALRARLERGASELSQLFTWERIGRETASFLAEVRRSG